MVSLRVPLLQFFAHVCVSYHWQYIYMSPGVDRREKKQMKPATDTYTRAWCASHKYDIQFQ